MLIQSQASCAVTKIPLDTFQDDVARCTVTTHRGFGAAIIVTLLVRSLRPGFSMRRLSSFIAFCTCEQKVQTHMDAGNTRT